LNLGPVKKSGKSEREGVFVLGNPGRGGVQSYRKSGWKGGRGVKNPCHPLGGCIFSGITQLPLKVFSPLSGNK